ncbi:MAG: LLM class flavin-dependent oxidoreductase [Porticoccaceae bacterium]|nr:LLM class flavin-dependent oxidoreductase [Porticoccaceae bacterium]
MIHLGLTPWSSDRSAQSLIEQAVFGEQLGYKSFWLPENHFNEDAIPDPLMLLASVAGATNTIKLATTSYLLPLRHPLQAAEQVAVLDQLCGGRVLLGIGRGVGATMLNAFDVLPAQKRELFERNLQQMITAWSGARVNNNSSNNSLSKDSDPHAGVVLHPLPLQKPHPEIWIAAFGPKALAQAGRLGLPYFASPLETLDDLIRNFALHSDTCESAGQTIPPTRPIMRRIFVSEDNATIQALRKQLSKGDQGSQWRAQHAELDDWMLIGNQAFVRQKIEEYQRRLGLTHLVVTPLQQITGDKQTESLRLVAEALS